jgi:hypothetical protein
MWCALRILTSKCASRHNSVHFLNISTFLSLIDSFSSLTLPASAFPSVHIVGSFLLKIVPECGQLLKTMLPGIPRNSQVENARKLMKMVETLGVPTTQGLSLSHHALRFTTGIAPLQSFSRALRAWHEPLVLPACRTWETEICKRCLSSENGRPNMAWVPPGRAAVELLVQP